MHRMSRWERRREEDSSDDCNVVPFDQYSIRFSSLLHMSYQIHITFFFGYLFFGSLNSWIELKEIGIFDQYLIRPLVYWFWWRSHFFHWLQIHSKVLWYTSIDFEPRPSSFSLLYHHKVRLQEICFHISNIHK